MGYTARGGGGDKSKVDTSTLAPVADRAGKQQSRVPLLANAKAKKKKDRAKKTTKKSHAKQRSSNGRDDTEKLQNKKKKDGRNAEGSRVPPPQSRLEGLALREERGSGRAGNDQRLHSSQERIKVVALPPSTAAVPKARW